ncbi:MAG: serine hydrolase [Gemmatimonadetes bacterium]|nr:serine hydrolase [Gemmatimonadota bacterium]
MKIQRLLASALLATLTATAAAQPATDLSSVDPVVTSMMAEWKVPGLALGVIKDGKVIYAKGYGFRDVEAKLPVTPRTIMAIGSNSKSFAVVLLGMMIDEKKLAWDNPVRSYLPDFQMHDDYATKHLTVRDLVNHRSGLPRHDVVWYGRKVTRKEIVDRIRYLEPTTTFRNYWQYQNLMFVTAGYLPERLAGRSWEDLVRDRIFTPLGMTRANASVLDSPKSDDFAYPYGIEDGNVVRIPFRNIDHVAPAGSINASVEDMLKYIQFRIDSGRVGGKQLLTTAQVAEMEQPQMAMGAAAALWSGVDVAGYGLGVGVGFHRGHRLIIHGGGIDGFISQMSWLPNERVGVMVLTNQGQNNPIPTLVVQSVYDRILGLTPIDWAARQRELDKVAAKARADAAAKRVADRKPGTTPSHPVSALAGRFHHPGYGTVVVQTAGAGLELVVDVMRAALEHYHYNVFSVRPGSQAGMLQGMVTFLTNTKGEVDRVSIPLEPALPPIVLERRP